MRRQGIAGNARQRMAQGFVLALLAACLPLLQAQVAHADTAAGSMLVPLLPARIVNSSTGLGLDSDMGADQTKTFSVTGVGGVPATGTTAVVLNVTATTSTTDGYMKLWTAGETQPSSSQMWHQAGERTSNLTTLAPSADGRIAIYNSAGSVSIRVDVEGYYATNSSGAAGFFPLTQQRVVDSTAGLVTTQGRIATGGTRTFKLAGLGGIPTSGVSAAVINVTAVNPTADTYLYVWPAAAARPAATAVQAPSGVTVATQVVTELDSAGKISVQNAGGPTDFYVDVQGYYTAQNGAQGSRYVPIVPKRVVATPAPKPASAHALPAGSYETFQIAGTSGIPLANVNALQLAITAQSSSGSANGQITAFPTPTQGHWGSGTPITYVSPGVKGVNSAILPVSASGTIDVRFSGSGTVDVYVDVYGYFAGTTLPTAPTSVVATSAQQGAVVQWAHPSSDGRSPITSFRVTNLQSGATKTVSALQSATSISGLSATSSYRFTVAAINDNGTGPESVATAAVTPSAALGPVVIYSPLYQDGSTTSWLAPQNLPSLFWQDANATTDHYEYSEDGAAPIAAASGDAGVSWYPTAGSHTFKVRAVDSSGNAGPWAQISFTVDSSPTPAQATDLTSVPDSDGSLNLSAVTPSKDGGVVTEFYVNGADGNPIAGAPFYADIAEDPGQRIATLVDASQYRSAGPITWWVVTCHGDQCSMPTVPQTVSFGAPVMAPATHQITLPASLVSTSQLQYQSCDSCDTGRLYLGGPSGADRQAYVLPDLSQFGSASPIVSATLHLHVYGPDNSSVEESQVIDSTKVAGAPVENDEIAVDMDSQTAAFDGSLNFDLTNLLSVWAAGNAPQGGVILKAPTATSTAVMIGSAADPITADRPYITVDLADAAAPTPVRQLTATGGDGGVFVTWLPPISTGSDSSRSYLVTAQSAGTTTTTTTTTTDLAAVIPNLANGAAYTITVRAVTSAGQSAPASTNATPAAIGNVSTVAPAAAQYAIAARTIADAPTQSVSDVLAGSSMSANFADQISGVSSHEAAVEGLAQLLQPSDGDDPTTSTVTPLLVVPTSNGNAQVLATVTTTTSVTADDGSANDYTASTLRAFTFSGGPTPRLIGVADPVRNLAATVSGTPPEPATNEPNSPSLDWQTGVSYAVALRSVPPVDPPSSITPQQDSVAAWARAHYQDPTEFGDNCTNFASKAFHFGGGFPMLGSPTSPSADPLEDWYYVSTFPGRSYPKWTRSWTVAADFADHLGDGTHGVRGRWRGRDQAPTTSPYENPKDVRLATVGDLVFFHFPGWPGLHHTTTVTGHRLGEPTLTYQTTNRVDVRVSRFEAMSYDAFRNQYPTISVWHPWRYTYN